MYPGMEPTAYSSAAEYETYGSAEMKYSQQMAAAAAPAGQFIMAPPMAQGQAATGYMPQIATYNAQGQLVLQPAGSYAFQVQ